MSIRFDDLIREGLCFYHNGEYSESVKRFTEAIQINPEDFKPYLYRARSTWDTYNNTRERTIYGEFYDDYQKVLKLDPSNVEAHIALGNYTYHAYEIGSHDSIEIPLNYYYDVCELDDKCTQGYIGRAIICYDIGIYKKYERRSLSLEKGPYYDSDFLMIGKEQMLNEVINDLSKSIDVDSENYISLNNRGVAYYDLGDYSKAVDDFTKAINIDVSQHLGYYNRALAQYHLNQFNKVFSDIDDSIKMGLPESKASVVKAKYLTKMGKFQQAIEMYNVAKNTGLGIKQLDELSKEKKKNVPPYESVIEIVHIDSKLPQTNAVKEGIFYSPFFGLSETYFMKGDYEKSLSALPDKIDMENSGVWIDKRIEADIHFRKGTIYEANNEPERALEEFQKALRGNFRIPEYGLKLASFNLKRGFVSDALNNCARVLDGDEKNEIASEMKLEIESELDKTYASNSYIVLTKFSEMISKILKDGNQDLQKDLIFGLINTVCSNIPVHIKNSNNVEQDYQTALANQIEVYSTRSGSDVFNSRVKQKVIEQIASLCYKLLVDSVNEINKPQNVLLSSLFMLNGQQDLLDIFEKNRIDVNSNQNIYGLTPLHIACRNQDLDSVSYLCSKGASPNIRDYLGNTSFHHLALIPFVDSEEYLQKAEQFGEDWVPVHKKDYRVLNYIDSIVKILIENKGYIDLKNQEGDTASETALLRASNIPVALIFEKYGLDLPKTSTLNNVMKWSRWGL